MTLAIGIDPGTDTGFAVWDIAARNFLGIEAGSMLQIMKQVLALHGGGPLIPAGSVLVVIEDARKAYMRPGGATYGKVNRLQGVGSVKRDCKLWVEFLDAEKIPYQTIKPRRRKTKKDAALFARITGWQGRTNEHGRDAAMFVWETTEAQARLAIEKWRTKT